MNKFKKLFQLAISLLLLVNILGRINLKEAFGAENQFSSCSESSIWNGKECKPIVYKGETAIVGSDLPVSSRVELDEIERNFVRRSFPNFPEELFTPNTQEKGQRIQDIRIENFKKTGEDFERNLEFIINTPAKNLLDQNTSIIGADALTTLIKHVEAINEIWLNSWPKIQRKAVLKRIIIVDPNVLSSNNGGWQVVNDHNFGWWSNDELNRIRGFIPYDIDSRWALDENWPECCLLRNTTRFQGVKIDYGLLHELTHHLPVGDNYVYNFGRGHGFTIPQPRGKNVFFPWSALYFMPNDHMTSPAAKNLTAPSSYHILYFWKLNPKHARNAQDFSIYPFTHIYGNFFYDNLIIKITGLEEAKIKGCYYLKEGPLSQDPAVPAKLEFSSDYRSLSFANGECTLTLNKENQKNAFPGGYIGLQKGETIFPVYIPGNLMETFFWQADLAGPPTQSFTFTLKATGQLPQALQYYTDRIQKGTETIDMSPSPLWAYIEFFPEEQVHKYIYEYRYLDPQVRSIIFSGSLNSSPVTPTPTPTTPPPVGDFNKDGKINYFDLEFLLDRWLTPEADLNEDRITNEKDLTLLITNWSP